MTVRALVVAFLLVAAAPLAAAPVDGSWSGSVPTPNGDFPVTFKFMADGTMLNGSMLGMDGMELPIANGKIEGNNLSYTLSLDFGGMPFELSYKGVLAGDQIALTGEAGGMPFEFVVKRDKTQ